MESIKRKVRVVIEKEIEVELTPEMFRGMTVEEYLDEFRKSLWDVKDADDVAKYAARMAATGYTGMEVDGLGFLAGSHSGYLRKPDVVANEISSEISCEIVD